MVNILFVCMGNICRSPMAEGAFRAAAAAESLLDRLHVDSAGTVGYHEGEAPDRRAQATAKNHNVDISGLRARKIRPEDFETFDYILAMDHDNLAYLTERCPQAHRHKLGLFLKYAPDIPLDEIPDPYHGHISEFETCYIAAMDAAAGLLAHIKETRL